MPDHPDDSKLDKEHAALTKATRRRQRSGTVEMSLVVGAAVLVAVSTVFSAWNTFELRELRQEEIRDREIIQLGTECVVEQLSIHRHMTGLAHRAAAAAAGYTYPLAEGDEPPVIPGVLDDVCEVFLHTTTSTTR